MKKLIVMLVAAIALVSFSVPVLAEVPVIKKVEYDGRGYVEVDFLYDVQYSNVLVGVEDGEGVVYNTVIRELDDDDLSFAVENIIAGREYNFTVSGVRSGFSGEYASVSGSFSVPGENEIVIKGYDYDGGDRELEIDFNRRVEFVNPAVEIRDVAGNGYEGRILEMDRDSIELRVGELKYGEEYSVVVTGVRLEGSAETVTVSGSFIAR